MNKNLVEELLSDWIKAECKIIGEFSSDSVCDYEILIKKAKRRSKLLGIRWHDELVPDYVSDLVTPM